MQIETGSAQYIMFALDGPQDDLTGYPVEAALMPDDGSMPAAGDWKPCVWLLNLATGRKESALLYEPADYPDGDYMLFARVTADPELPLLRSGRVRIGAPD